MKLLSPDLIREYYESIKESHPDLTLAQVEEICQAPFIEVKKGMESGTFPTIRLKFFGTFLTYPKRVAGVLKLCEQSFKDLKMAPNVYFKKKEQLETYLKKQNYEGYSDTRECVGIPTGKDKGTTIL